MKKTYDVVEGERSGLNLIYIRLWQDDQLNSRKKLLRSLADFDEKCLEVETFFSREFHIELLKSKWSGPQWIVSQDRTTHQQINYEPLAINRETWAGIQGTLDQNEWERW